MPTWRLHDGVDIVADMEVDKVADKVADMVADMVTSKYKRCRWWPTWR